ncbi:hypothetical protein MMC29_003011 [Sticta canariensis]|nr:hypothetical protein [Sticta canariensis]
MNWSGGALSRSRNSNTSRSAAQKRHFAKARGKLPQARQSFADFDFSTLEHARIEIESEAPTRQSAARLPHQSLRSSSLVTPSSSKKHIRSKPSESTPSFWSALKPNDCHGSGTVDGDIKISEEARLEAQKQELLAMKDWCGLKSTWPVKISFPDIADVDLIGKRRPVLTTNRERSRRQGQKYPRLEADTVKTSKKREIYSDEESDKSCRREKSNLLCKNNSSAQRIAMDTEHIGRCSNSEEMLLDTTIAAKYSGTSFNSDENLFDLENAIQVFRQKSPTHMSLSPQIPSTTRPSPLKYEIEEAGLACDDSDGQFDAVSDPSQKYAPDSWEGRLDSRLLLESLSCQRGDSPRFTHISSHAEQKADCDDTETQSGEPPARSTRSIPDHECLEECVTLSPAIHDCGSDVRIGIRPSSTNLPLTSISKAGVPTEFLMEDNPPLKSAKKSPLASATLSDMNDLRRQSMNQAPTTSAIINSNPSLRAKVTDKLEVLPSVCEATETAAEESTALAKQEPGTATREKSLSPETVWKNFILGNSDEESIDDQHEFILPGRPRSRCSPVASVKIEPPPMDAEPCSMNVEPSLSLHPTGQMSTNVYAPSPACLLQPRIIFKKPGRFQGERAAMAVPPIRLGCQRPIKHKAPSSDQDDVIED